MNNPITLKLIVETFLSFFNDESQSPHFLNRPCIQFDALPLSLRKFANLSRGFNFDTCVEKPELLSAMQGLRYALLNLHKNEHGIEEWPFHYCHEEVKTLKRELKKCHVTVAEYKAQYPSAPSMLNASAHTAEDFYAYAHIPQEEHGDFISGKMPPHLEAVLVLKGKPFPTSEMTRPTHIIKKYVEDFKMWATVFSEDELADTLALAIMNGPAAFPLPRIAYHAYDLLIFSGLMYDMDQQISNGILDVNDGVSAVIGRATYLLDQYLKIDMPSGSRDYRLLRFFTILFAFRRIPACRFTKVDCKVLIELCHSDMMMHRSTCQILEAKIDVRG